jgi:NADH-quinone oxidoreductase subunit C
MLFKFCFFLRYNFDLFPKIFNNAFFSASDSGFFFNYSTTKLLATVLRLHSLFQFKQLIGLTSLAPRALFGFSKSFLLSYFFLSLLANLRLSCKCLIMQDQGVESITFLYKSGGWAEREVWDLYGIFFVANADLRRILTDYGFVGYPFRKDFPITGFLELRYEEFGKRIRYLPVSLAQEFRNFTLSSAWENK